MRKIQLLSLLALLVMGMTSCKYEEGPFLSVIPKVERVTNTWVVNEAVKNGTSSTSIDGFKEITFFKEGDCQIVYAAGSFEFAYSGTWTFADSKETIHILANDDATGLSTYENDWTILRLKEDELKVSFTEGSDAYVATFEPAI